MHHLNGKKIPTRRGGRWQRTTILNFLNRFNAKDIDLTADTLKSGTQSPDAQKT
jgi:hypothetical protein